MPIWRILKWQKNLATIENAQGPYNFEIYCGKVDARKTPLGPHVVKTMLKPITHIDSHVVFFNNFLTSHKLLEEVAERNIRACGAIREGRTGCCPLEPIKSIEKKPRGSYDYRFDGTVLCMRWNDNRAVTLATNYYGKETISHPYAIKM